jgi:hypothetical protein
MITDVQVSREQTAVQCHLLAANWLDQAQRGFPSWRSLGSDAFHKLASIVVPAARADLNEALERER